MRECHQKLAARDRKDSEDFLCVAAHLENRGGGSPIGVSRHGPKRAISCEAYSVAAEDQGKMIITNIVPSLRTRGDEDLLAEMLANLLDNALRHTPVGTQIEGSICREGSKIIASVADNGLGVPEEERERIFQRFYRLKRSAKVEG